MTDIARRHVLTGLAVAGGALAAQAATAQAQLLDRKAVKKDTDIACVYHCDFGDPARVGQMITNIDNHLSVYDYDPFKAKIVVVARCCMRRCTRRSSLVTCTRCAPIRSP